MPIKFIFRNYGIIVDIFLQQKLSLFYDVYFLYWITLTKYSLPKPALHLFQATHKIFKGGSIMLLK